ncbi:hypothetical protein CLAIMM_14193 isoform 2 [Cladophialophora immunda]|nr:hypothetical protein CLAIMM_14193 isoform 1 [Cladophialophora immunda]OQV10156.1 hypothetical protein CLAIMM_14193 isoform 2 [Cladophialophora immunda]
MSKMEAVRPLYHSHRSPSNGLNSAGHHSQVKGIRNKVAAMRGTPFHASKNSECSIRQVPLGTTKEPRSVLKQAESSPKEGQDGWAVRYRDPDVDCDTFCFVFADGQFAGRRGQLAEMNAEVFEPTAFLQPLPQTWL